MCYSSLVDGLFLVSFVVVSKRFFRLNVLGLYFFAFVCVFWEA